MKTFVRHFYCVITGFFLSTNFSNALAADTNPPPRLTVELRDGSRVVGTSAENYFKFHTTLIGEIKLDVKDIRSIECVSSNSAKLSTANGDSLTVSFVDSEFAVKTSFGKVELAVDSVREFSVSAGGAGTHPPGLVALWSGEGDGNDSVGGNNTTLTDISFADGQVGQAFSFNGTTSCIKIPASQSLDVGAADGFTITAWIKPSDVTQDHPIFEWNNGSGTWGVHFHIVPTGELNVNLIDTGGNWHRIWTANNVVTAGVFQHVALTYSETTGTVELYVNGVPVPLVFSDGSGNDLGVFTPLTTLNLYLGRRPVTGSNSACSFAGLLDEASVYNRALSASEIQTICTEQNNGEPLPPPTPSRYPMPFNGRFFSPGRGGLP